MEVALRRWLVVSGVLPSVLGRRLALAAGGGQEGPRATGARRAKRNLQHLEPTDEQGMGEERGKKPH